MTGPSLADSRSAGSIEQRPVYPLTSRHDHFFNTLHHGGMTVCSVAVRAISPAALVGGKTRSIETERSERTGRSPLGGNHTDAGGLHQIMKDGYHKLPAKRRGHRYADRMVRKDRQQIRLIGRDRNRCDLSP